MPRQGRIRSQALIGIVLCLGLQAAPGRGVVEGGGLPPSLPSLHLQPCPGGADELKEALGRIESKAVLAHASYLASPALEGRDSPSVGQELAAQYIGEHFLACGLEAAGDAVDAWKRLAGGDEMPAWSLDAKGRPILRPYRVEVDGGGRRSSPRTIPDRENCELEFSRNGESVVFELGRDYVPVPRCGGECAGEVVWAGFGIRALDEGYDDFKGVDLKGKVALIVEGEPRHKRKFKGEDVTALASTWNKIAAIEKEGASGVLIMRRPLPPAPSVQGSSKTKPKTKRSEEDAAPRMSYRYTYASFNPPDTDRWRDTSLPAVEISAECARTILGKDVVALAERIDRAGKAVRVRSSGRRIGLVSSTTESDLRLQNLVALLPGSDPELKHEVVVIGAHYDHIGVGKRGRVGLGADDNASGSAALLQLATAFKGLSPRRTIMFAAFSAEEDGLVGSAKLAADLPIPAENVVAMVNMDMLGRGETREVACMGFAQNPGMERIVARANQLGRTGVRKINEVNDKGLFQRSDHYSFHTIGVPVVFFMEGYPIEANKDYHTWRDTVDRLDIDKITASARLAFLTAWILANEDERLPAPRD